MLNLLQASRLRKGAGEKLPTVYRSWEQAGIHIRRGQLSLVASGPGVGKSALALAYAVKSREPILYLSMDTDALTTTIRAGQMLTRFPADRVEALLKDEEFSYIRLECLGHIDFSFRSGIDFTELSMMVAGYAEKWGAFPHLIVVDNLANIAFDGDEFGELRRIIADLHQLARMTQSAVIACHHVTGYYDSGTEPVPLSGLQGKISKMPELILTLSRGGDGTTLFVAPVKNRSGKADPSGLWRIPMTALLDSMTIEDR